MIGLETLASFVLGVISSIVAAYLILWRQSMSFSLRFSSILRMTDRLNADIRHDGFTFDHILSLGRNAGVIGSIMAGATTQNAVVSVTTLKERLPNGQRTISLNDVSERAISALQGRRVLVLLCCNDSGASLDFAMHKLAEIGVESAKSAALFSAPSPLYKPDYIVAIVGKDIRKSMTQILNGLPWTKKRWMHPLDRERRG